MNKKESLQRTGIGQLGEFGLISKLTGGFNLRNTSTVKGVGDDAAVLQYSGIPLVVTTDLLIEGVHFDLAYTPLKHLGYKAASVNFSDVYAMNAFPRQLFVSIAVSSRFSVEDLQELYDGIRAACDVHGADLAGGDTSLSLTGLMISITATGEVAPGGPVYRSTAHPNDIICVSGDLGAAYLGLQILEREKKIISGNAQLKPELDGHEYLIKRLLKPEARGDIISFFQKEEIVPTAMIDISDGLSSELMHICTRSAVGCKIFEDKIPLAAETDAMAREMGINPLVCALHGGEDYELLFTLSLKDFEKARQIPEIHFIGHITAAGSGMNLVTTAGQFIPLQAQGWRAF